MTASQEDLAVMTFDELVSVALQGSMDVPLMFLENKVFKEKLIDAIIVYQKKEILAINRQRRPKKGRRKKEVEFKPGSLKSLTHEGNMEVPRTFEIEFSERPFGFSLASINDNLVVKTILEPSLWQRGLKPGMRILKVGGTVLQGYTEDYCYGLLSKCDLPIKVLFRRQCSDMLNFEEKSNQSICELARDSPKDSSSQLYLPSSPDNKEEKLEAQAKFPAKNKSGAGSGNNIEEKILDEAQSTVYIPTVKPSISKTIGVEPSEVSTSSTARCVITPAPPSRTSNLNQKVKRPPRPPARPKKSGPRKSDGKSSKPPPAPPVVNLVRQDGPSHKLSQNDSERRSETNIRLTTPKRGNRPSTVSKDFLSQLQHQLSKGNISGRVSNNSSRSSSSTTSSGKSTVLLAGEPLSYLLTLEPESAEWSQECKKRIPILREIVMSEKSYLSGLEKLCIRYFDPIFEKRLIDISLKPIITQNVYQIYSFHHVFLVELQRSRNIPNVFSKHADFLRMYTAYVDGYDDMSKKILSLRQSNKKLKKFLENTARKKEVMIDIANLLILPIQRVPRYRLLLEDLQKRTLKEHRQYKDLEDALKKVKTISNHINESRRQIENRLRLLALTKQMSDEIGSTIWKASRKFLKQGKFWMAQLPKGDKTPPPKPVTVFLFNDALLLCLESVKFRQELPLRQVDDIKECKDFLHGEVKLFGLELSVQGMSYPLVLFVEKESERKVWHKEILNQVAKEKESSVRSLNIKIVTYF